MRSLLPLALALTLTTPAQAQYKTDKANTWDLTVATVAAFQCSASEGLMTIEDAVKASFEFLAKRRGLEPYQVVNIQNAKAFWPAVRAFQERHGGCPSIAAGIKSKAQQTTKTSPIY